MSATGHECLVFSPEALLPSEWRAAAGGGPVRTFNPALLRDRDGWLFAYRVVLPDGRRRLAIGRLGASLQFLEGSAVPLSDQVQFRPGADYPEIARHWFADPRLYRLGDRLFLYWNSGWHEPRNHQFLQELAPFSLTPIGHPRELILSGQRQPLEKNWTFFGDDHGLYAVYSIVPHRVMRFSVAGGSDIVFAEAAHTAWQLSAYPPCHGGLRGGAPPVRVGDEYWSFCHSVHDGPRGYCYAAAAYTFAAAAPFSPLREPVGPLDLGRAPRGRRDHPRLNPAVDEVIYPCGAARDGDHWLISHGINDERCAVSRVPFAEVLASLRSRGSSELDVSQTRLAAPDRPA